MDPEFAPDNTEYTATTDKKSDVITAEAAEGVGISISVNGVGHENGVAAEWKTDDTNIVEITVTTEDAEKTYTVIVTHKSDATLKTLKVGSLVLNPTFDPATAAYTVTTHNDTNTVTAEANDGEANVIIKVNEGVHTSGESATWIKDQENTVEVTVTHGVVTEIYTVIVTHATEV